MDLPNDWRGEADYTWSSSRANYAAGSLRAARFLAGQSRGLFGMPQVLGLPE